MAVCPNTNDSEYIKLTEAFGPVSALYLFKKNNNTSPSVEAARKMLKTAKTNTTNTQSVESQKLWIEKTLGLDVHKVQGLVDGKAWGKFQNAAIYLSNAAIPGTAYHEAFHAVFSLYLTDKEQKSILEDVLSRNPILKQSKEPISNKVLEEFAAEEFREYVLSEGSIKFKEGSSSNFFTKIWNFIKGLVSKSVNTEDLYKNIINGRYKNAVPLANRVEESSVPKYKIKGEFKSGDKEYALTSEQVKDTLDGISFYLFDELFKEGDPTSLLETKGFTSDLYDKIRDKMITRARIVVTENYKNNNIDKSTYLVGLYSYLFGLNPNNMSDDKTNMTKWVELIDEHRLYLRDLGITSEQSIDSDSEEGEIEKGKSSLDTKESFKYSIKDRANTAIKMLIASIPDTTPASEQGKFRNAQNDLGFYKLGDLDKNFNLLAATLADTPADFDLMMQKVNSLIATKPNFQILIDRLNNETVKSEELRTKFVNTFTKTNHTHLLSLIKENGNIVSMDANSERAIDKVKSIWGSNYSRNVSATNLHTVYSTIKDRFETAEKAKTDDATDRYLFAAYNALGIQFPTPDFIEFNRNYLLNTLKRIVSYGMVDSKAIDIYKDKSVVSAINELASLISKDNDDTELQFINASGELVHGITLHNYLTMLTADMNNLAGDKEKLSAQLPQWNSIYAKRSLLKKEIENGNKLEVNILSGYKSEVNPEDALDTKDTTFPTKYSQFISATLDGKYTFLRAADRGVENAFNISGKKGLLIQNETHAINTFIDYLKDEIELAQQDSILYTNLRYAKDKVGQLRFFEGILTSSKESVYKAIQEGTDSDLLFEDTVLKTAVEQDIKTYFSNRLTEEKNLIESLGLLDINPVTGTAIGLSAEQLSKYSSVDELLKSYIWNHQAAYIEQTKLLVGDPHIFKNSTDFFKRMSMFNSTKEFARVDNKINDHLNQNYKRTDGKLSDGKISSIVYDDVQVSSSYINSIGKSLVDSFEKHDFRGKSNARSLAEKKAGVRISEDGTASLILNSDGNATGYIAPYTDMTEADAQGYITLDEYRELLNRLGKWNEKFEKAYQYEVQSYLHSVLSNDEFNELFKEHDPSGNFKNKSGKKFSPHFKGRAISNRDTFLFQPLKTQYTGPISELSGTQAYITTGYKHSLLPLLPSALTDSNLKGLMEHMRKNGVGIAQFSSANKFGTILNESGEINNFYTEEGNINTEGLTTQSIDMKYFGIQLEIAPVIKNKITATTQGRKLIWSSSFGADIEVSEHTAALFDEYTAIQNELIETSFQNTLEELSLVPKKNSTGDTVGYTISNRNKVVKFLKNQAITSRNVPQNVLDSLEELAKDGNYIDTIHSKLKIENLLMSLVYNNTISEKRNGGSKIQVASTGFEVKRDWADKNKKILGSNNLKFYEDIDGKVTKMEIMMALPKQWENWVTSLGGLDSFNTMISEGKIDERLLSVVGFRIPNQLIASSDSAKIVKFLPSNSADAIVLPSEIVAKAGSDFDIDKLNLYLPNFDIVFENESDIINNINNHFSKRFNVKIYGQEFLDKYRIPEGAEGILLLEEYLADFKEDPLNSKKNPMTRFFGELYKIAVDHPKVKEVKYVEETHQPGDSSKRRKQRLQNRMMSIHQDILGDSKNARFLLAPINDIILKNLVAKIRKLKGIDKDTTSITNLMEGSKNMTMFKYFLSGKSGVGQTAVHLTSHTLTQIANAYLKGTSYHFFPHNKITIDGISYPSLAHQMDVDGNFIIETLSAFLNAYVDIAKDPYIFDLNAGNQTANTIFLMLRLGASPEYVASFMSQPIIIDYIKEQEKNESIFKKAFDLDDSKTDLVNGVVSKYGASSLIVNSIYYNLEENDRLLETFGHESPVLKQDAERASESYEVLAVDTLQNMISRNASNKLSKKDNELQVQLLDQFLEYQRQSKHFQKFVRATSPDTKRAKNRNDLYTQLRERNEVLSSEFVGNADKIFTETFIESFANAQHDTASALQEFFMTDKQEFKVKLDSLKSLYRKMHPKAVTNIKISNDIDNHFLTYLVMTSQINTMGTPIKYGVQAKDVDELFNSKSIAAEILSIQNGTHSSYAHLRNNPFIKNLVPIINKEGSNTSHLKMFSRRLNTYTTNYLVDGFEEIFEVAPELANKLAKFGIVQSGLSPSPISFVDFIPAHRYYNIVNEAVKKYDSGLVHLDFNEFIEQFARHTPQYLPKFKLKESKQGGYYLPTGIHESSARSLSPYAVKYNKKSKSYSYFVRTSEVKDDFIQYAPANFGRLGDGIYRMGYEKGKTSTNSQVINDPTIPNTYDEVTKKYSENLTDFTNNITQENFIEQIKVLENHFNANGIPVSIVMNENMVSSQRGAVEYNPTLKKFIVEINPNIFKGETLPHEFSHIFVDILGHNHPLVRRGINQVKTESPKLWKEVYNRYMPKYKDLAEVEKELLVTAMGKEGEKYFTTPQAKKKWYDFITLFFKRISEKLGLTNPNTVVELFNQMMSDDLGTIVDKAMAYDSTKKYSFSNERRLKVQDDVAAYYLNKNNSKNNTVNRVNMGTQTKLDLTTDVKQEINKENESIPTNAREELIINFDKYYPQFYHFDSDEVEAFVDAMTEGEIETICGL